MLSYIKPQHDDREHSNERCCLPMLSYIKPQHHNPLLFLLNVVYQCFPTSNHNMHQRHRLRHSVVYQCFPTSNHNSPMMRKNVVSLFTNAFLHQTTTGRSNPHIRTRLFTNAFLHQTTTVKGSICSTFSCLPMLSYIKPQLRRVCKDEVISCLPMLSYIKPQLSSICHGKGWVVYQCFPTSNHNHEPKRAKRIPLFTNAFLHQTTTRICSCQ